MPATGTITIDGSFNPPITSAAWGLRRRGAWLRDWSTSRGSSTRRAIRAITSTATPAVSATPHANVAAGAPTSCSSAPTAALDPDHDGGSRVRRPDRDRQRLVGLITSFLDPVRGGPRQGRQRGRGRRSDALRAGRRTVRTVGQQHNDFVAQPTADRDRKCANTFGTTLSTTFGDVTVRSSKRVLLTRRRLEPSRSTTSRRCPRARGAPPTPPRSPPAAASPAYSFALAGDSGPSPAGLTWPRTASLSGTPTGTGTRHIIGPGHRCHPEHRATKRVRPHHQSTAVDHHGLAAAAGTGRPRLRTAVIASGGARRGCSARMKRLAAGGSLGERHGARERPTVDGSSSFNVHVTDSYGSTNRQDVRDHDPSGAEHHDRDAAAGHPDRRLRSDHRGPAVASPLTPSRS